MSLSIPFKRWLLDVYKRQGQTSSASNVKPSGKVQPKIMVIPFTKEGEDIRTILEDDINKRIAITKIKEAFDERGFTTVDFTAKLKACLLYTSRCV